MSGVPGDLKHKRTSTEQAIQDRKDATLREICDYILANNATYSQVKEYAEEHDREDWREVLRSRQRRYIILAFTKDNNIATAKEREKKFYQWCKDNNLSVSEGFEKALDMPEFKGVGMTPASVKRLYRMEQAELSKKAKEGKPNSRKPKAVRCVDNGMEFPSINKAAEYFGITRTHDISDCCYGVIGNVRGLHFEFIDQNKE